MIEYGKYGSTIKNIKEIKILLRNFEKNQIQKIKCKNLTFRYLAIMAAKII